ncbi:hypothetical protein D3C84_261100 [compost metagenome]
MFRTPIDAEDPLFRQYFSEDYRTWKYVELTLAHVWFYVTVVQRVKFEQIRSILMLDNLALLDDLLSDPHSGREVESIQLVTPGRLNGSGDWRMERLLRIEHLIDHDSVAYIYEVKNNITYVDGDRNLLTQARAERNVIFEERQMQVA